MKILAYGLAAALYLVFIGIALLIFGLFLPLFVVGYTVYKIPRIIREHRRFNRALKEITRGD